MAKLPDFEGWAIFAAVVEHRSFSGAASALQLSKATVSKAITRLETSLGTSLFHRTSRRLTLTDSGEALAERAQRLLADAHAAEEAARDKAQAPAGTVRIAAPMTFGIHHVAPAIADFLHAHPDIDVDLTLSDARVDLIAEGIDIALRIADLPDSSLRARRLGPIDVHLVAAPGYLARAGHPAHPSDLARHACFAYANAPGPGTWQFQHADGSEVSVRPQGPLRTDNGEAMLPALRAGLGIARLPEFIAGPDLAAGTLVSLLREWTAPPVALHLVTPPGRLRPARVELLLDHLADRLRRLCAGAAPGMPAPPESPA